MGQHWIVHIFLFKVLAVNLSQTRSVLFEILIEKIWRNYSSEVIDYLVIHFESLTHDPVFELIECQLAISKLHKVVSRAEFHHLTKFFMGYRLKLILFPHLSYNYVTHEGILTVVLKDVVRDLIYCILFEELRSKNFLISHNLTLLETCSYYFFYFLFVFWQQF